MLSIYILSPVSEIVSHVGALKVIRTEERGFKMDKSSFFLLNFALNFVKLLR